MAGGDVERAADLVELNLAVVRRDRQEPLLRELARGAARGRGPECGRCSASRYAGSDAGHCRGRAGSRPGSRTPSAGWRRWLGPTTAARTGMVAVNEQELALAADLGRGLPRRAGPGAGGRRDDRRPRAPGARACATTTTCSPSGPARRSSGSRPGPKGDLETTHASYVACLDTFERAGHVADVLGIAITVGDIYVIWGRLGDAMRTYEDALRLAADRGRPAARDRRHVRRDERGPLRARRPRRPRARTCCAARSSASTRVCRRTATGGGWPWPGSGRPRATSTGALDLLDEADRVYVGDFSPRVRPVPALKARVWIRQGRLDEVREWARREGLSADDELTYLREFEHVTLARARSLAEGPTARRGRRPARPASRRGRGRRPDRSTVIEILVLQALARQLRGDAAGGAVTRSTVRWTSPSRRATSASSSTRGSRWPSCCGRRRRRAPRAAYVADGCWTALGRARAGPSAVALRAELVEPLSEREHDVLRLLATDLSGPEIARRLVVSLNTVRTHTKNVYAKLGVNSRRAAVRRAEELDL